MSWAGPKKFRPDVLSATCLTIPPKVSGSGFCSAEFGQSQFFYSALLLRRVPAAAAAEYSEEYSHIGWIKVEENEDWSSLILVT